MHIDHHWMSICANTEEYSPLQEPTKHQYDFDVATTSAFLLRYGLDKDFKVRGPVGLPGRHGRGDSPRSKGMRVHVCTRTHTHTRVRARRQLHLTHAHTHIQNGPFAAAEHRVQPRHPGRPLLRA